MQNAHIKSLRGRILKTLYGRYAEDPLAMVTQEELLGSDGAARKDVFVAISYLADAGLAELMRSYGTTTFTAARITVDGIDLVEDHFAFNRRFPTAPGELEDALRGVPAAVERLVEEADASPLAREERRRLLRDILFLREELSLPAEKWRPDVIRTVLAWIEGHCGAPQDVLPGLAELRRLLTSHPGFGAGGQV